MSEPVSNSEIEDVLSSIRRLISENPAKGENGSDSAEKLVLTPAFRVLDGDAQKADSAPDASDTPTPEAVAESEVAAVAPDENTADAAPAPEVEVPEEATDKALCDYEAASEEKPDNAELELKIAELEAAIGESYDEWEPDGSAYEDDAEAPTMLHPAPEAPAEWEFVPEDAGASEAFGATGSPEPSDDMSAATMILDAEEITDEDEADGAEDGAEGDFVLDEEALRELVSQLVREQLKGQIGERITRSIRRMVRREIRLAMAVRERD